MSQPQAPPPPRPIAASGTDGAPSLGEWLRRWRQARGLTQATLARRVPCSPTMVRKIEGDERRPSDQLASRLADVLDLPSDARGLFLDCLRYRVGPQRLPLPTAPAVGELAPSGDPGGNLPTPPTPLLGRAAEVRAATALLRSADVRLLTLTGPGGTGKTRLALEVARGLRSDFADGVWFVDLAGLSTPDLAAAAIARGLGVRDPDARPLVAQLAAAVRDRDPLLVLDNFEHLLDAAPLVAELLAAGPRLKVLVTSRTPLRLRGEHELAVPPLELPDLAGLPEPEALARVPAVELFWQRARAVDPGFVLTAVSAVAVAEICVRVDGLPLAVELAAAQADVFGPSDIAAALRRSGLDALVDGAIDLPTRQRTMRGAIAWSHALLLEDEQALFRRLAVFAGGFDLEAAGPVCDPADDLARGVRGLIAALVRKSLVQRAAAGADGSARFVLLHTIREYGLERLIERSELEAVGQRHAAHYTALAARASPRLAGPEQVDWFNRLEREHDNLRAALRWLVKHGDSERALRLAGALWRFWWAHGHRGEGRQWLAEVLTLPEGRTRARAEALLGAATLAADSYERGQAHPLAEEALALFRELGDRVGIARSLQLQGRLIRPGTTEVARARLNESLAIGRELDDDDIVAGAVYGLGLVASREGDFATASPLIREGLAIWRARGDRLRCAAAQRSLGYVTNYQGDLVATWGLLEESLELYREVGDSWSMAAVLGDLGEVATALGEFTAARGYYEEGLALWRRVGSRQGVANMLGGAGYAVTEEGDFARARALFAESLAIRRQTGEPARLAWSLAGFAYLAAAQGNPERAVRLAGSAAALREASGWVFVASSQAKLDRRLVPARAALGEAAAAAAWAAGHAMSEDEAIADALRPTPVRARARRSSWGPVPGPRSPAGLPPHPSA